MFLLVSGANALVRNDVQQPSIATKFTGLEGEACDNDEWNRYKTIVCKVEDTCNCAETQCDLEWCSEYVHEWKKEFGAIASALDLANDGLVAVPFVIIAR